MLTLPFTYKSNLYFCRRIGFLFKLFFNLCYRYANWGEVLLYFAFAYKMFPAKRIYDVKNV